MRGLAAASIMLAVFVAGCGGGDGAEPETTEAAPAEMAVAGEPGRGKSVFLNAGCGGCHTFQAAGSTRNVGPNLDQAVQMYDEAFIRESIVDPAAYIERGSAGEIGGDDEYGTEMLPYGPDEDPPQHLTEQELADLVAFLVSAKS
jgi:mono/diheme cytochrome c family protein